MPHYTGLEEANPFIVRDLSKCILCGKCIRADHEMVVVGAIDYNLRGFKSRPATAHEMPLEKSTCTFCGTCVSMCPTGALMVKSNRYVGSPEKELRSICGFCGVGCSLVMGVVDAQIVEVNPSHDDGSVNRSTLCVRGHFAHDFLNVSERLTHPWVLKDGERSPAPWEEALNLVAERLLSIKRKNGPQSMGFLGSSKCTNEENYLFQKIARVIVGTNNVDHGSTLLGRFVLQRVHERLHGRAWIAPLAGLERAEVILVIGADPSESLPVVSYYLKRAGKIHGIPMIVVDPRRTGLVPFSSLWLAVAPHSDCELIHALAAILYQRKAYDAPFIDRFTKGFDRYSEVLSSLDIERASRRTGLDTGMMERAADSLQGKKIAIVVGQGVLQQRDGTEAMDALLNLALMTGSLGGEAMGIYFLATENNQVGAWDMGTVPDSLPGHHSISNDLTRQYWEQTWRVKLSPDPGLHMIRMIEEAEKGNLKALYIMGENPLRALPQRERIRNALKSLEFLVVQDILSNETTDLADVVLPGAAFAEKGGSFTNLEGRIQSFEPVVSPPGEAKPDWEILDLLANRMGHHERYSHLHRIRLEMRRSIPMYSVLGEASGESWIKGRSTLKLFNPHGEGELIHFAPITSTAHEEPDARYPYIAILGSVRYHLGSGTRTGHSDRIKNFDLRGEVEISLEDGARLNLKKRDRVRISSMHGSILRQVTLKRGISPGLIFVPAAFNDNDARQLLNLVPSEANHSIGWKTIRVMVERLDA
jgi:formate dehydrogenase alpha subunit